ncbi:MAG: hypothetical protein ACKVIN_01560 [Longimicrobiales bacterium]
MSATLIFPPEVIVVAKGSGVNPGASEELPKLGLLLPMLSLP